MKIILNTHSSNDDYNADFDYAVVDIDRDTARLFLKRMVMVERLKKEDEYLSCIHFADYSPTFFSATDDFSETDAASQLCDEDYVEAPAGFTPPADHDEYPIHRTEMDRLVVYDDSLYWEVTPKHSSIAIETRFLPRSLIAQIAEV